MARKKRRKKGTDWKKKADDQWSLAVRLSHKRCEICGKPGTLIKSGLEIGGLNAHHVIGRSNMKFRHDLNNGLCLCVYCHRFRKDLSPHAGSVIGVSGFIDWFKENKPVQWAWFMKRKFDSGKSEYSFEENYRHLKEVTDKMLST